MVARKGDGVANFFVKIEFVRHKVKRLGTQITSEFKELEKREKVNMRKHCKNDKIIKMFQIKRERSR